MGASSTPLAETSAFTANVYPPQPGTPILANDVQVGLEPLANRTKYLKGRLDADTVVAFTYNLGVGNFAAVVNSVSFVDAGSILVDVSGCQVGDKLLIDFTAMLQLSLAVANVAFIKIVTVEDFGGSPSTNDAPGGQRKVQSDEPVNTGIAITGLVTVATAGTCRVKIQARTANTGDNIDVEGWAVLRVQRIRP